MYLALFIAHWNYGSSVRISFPNNLSTSSSTARIELLKTRVRGIIQSKAKFPINRLGLCATNFEARMSGTITTFFGALATKTAVSEATRVLPAVPLQEEKSHRPNNTSSKLKIDSRAGEEKMSVRAFFLPMTIARGDYSQSAPSPTNELNKQNISGNKPFPSDEKEVDIHDPDEDYARQLQASFDRENALLTMVEQRHHYSKTTRVDRKNITKVRIDSFFTSKMKKA